MRIESRSSTLFFFNDTATTEIYTLSLHDALPIYPLAARSPFATPFHRRAGFSASGGRPWGAVHLAGDLDGDGDRKSTRLNSSHLVISYAVFCLKKKKEQTHVLPTDTRDHS